MCFFRRKVPKTKNLPLTDLEKEVLDFLANTLDEPYKSKLKNQISYLPGRKRISYPKSIVTEFYPDKENSIPNELLFFRTEEFHLGNIRFKIDNQRYLARFHMVLGSFFDISIKPLPPKKISNEKIEWIDFKIEENLDKNIYG